MQVPGRIAGTGKQRAVAGSRVTHLDALGRYRVECAEPNITGKQRELAEDHWDD